MSPTADTADSFIEQRRIARARLEYRLKATRRLLGLLALCLASVALLVAVGCGFAYVVTTTEVGARVVVAAAIALGATGVIYLAKLLDVGFGVRLFIAGIAGVFIVERLQPYGVYIWPVVTWMVGAVVVVGVLCWWWAATTPPPDFDSKSKR